MFLARTHFPAWGYTKIRDALRTGLKIEIGRTTVADILAEAGIEPAPERETMATLRAQPQTPPRDHSRPPRGGVRMASACLREQCLSAVAFDVDEGNRLDIQGTPSFFVEGKTHTGNYPPWLLSRLQSAAAGIDSGVKAP